MSTKLRKQDNTFVTVEEILAGSGIIYGDEPAGTENYLQVPDTNGNLINSPFYIETDNNIRITETPYTESALWSGEFGVDPDSFGASIGNKHNDIGWYCDILADYSGIGLVTSSYPDKDNVGWFYIETYGDTPSTGNPYAYMYINYFDIFDKDGVLLSRINQSKAQFSVPLNLTNLPTSAAGLSAGDVWNNAGTLKIV